MKTILCKRDSLVILEEKRGFNLINEKFSKEIWATILDVPKGDKIQILFLTMQVADKGIETNLEGLPQYNVSSNVLFFFTDLYKRPHTIYVPLFIHISRNFQPNTELTSEINKIPLSFKKALQSLNVAEALKNVLAQWNPETKDKAFRETQGVLGEPLVQKEEVD